MNKLSNKISKVSLICLMGILLFGFSTIFSNFNIASAEVYFEEGGNGKPDAIYVCGNPNAYPIEYYDSKTKTYKGVIPDMLKKVSKDTGIDFVYIYTGNSKKQRSIAKNKQAEMITAVLIEKDYDLAEKLPIISYKTSDKNETYCIGFTDITDKEKAETIKNTLSEISEDEKNGFLISNTEKPYPRFKYILFSVLATLFTCVVIIGLTILILYKKRKKGFNQDEYIDEETGIGNPDYYVYVFDNLISEQAKNLYSVAYIAFNPDTAEKKFGTDAINDIEKLAASKLINYAGSAEYISHITKGVFVFVFQSENIEKCKERIEQAVSGMNKYFSESYDTNKPLFNAGICRLCEHKGITSETAFYNAKHGYLYAVSKGITCHIGSESQLAQNRKDDKLRQSVSDAIKNGDFKIYMQLITDGKTGNFCGAEVLSRWQNIEYGLLKPAEYIELLKETDSIVEHDYNVFENVCRILQEWSKLPYKNMFLTCNFTRLSVKREDFAKKLKEISEKYKFSHNKLIIEITEDTLNSDSETLSKNILDCKRMDFKIAIDDMGTGFSSLADIYDNEIDIIKIERNFISSCVTDRRKKMLGDIITLAHNADAKIICEGIENAEQSEMLQKLNCDMMQGYYFSRVLPVKECEKILKSQKYKNVK